MMKRLGGKFGSVCMALSLTAGCDDGGSDAGAITGPNLDETTAALVASTAESAVEGDAQALAALAFPEDSEVAAGIAALSETAQGAILRTQAYVEANLSCAETSVSGPVLDIHFGQSCSWSGRRWSGSLAIDYAAGDGTANIRLEGVAVSGASLSGDIDVTYIADSHLAVSADLEAVRPTGIRVEAAWDAEFEWNEERFAIVSSLAQATIDGAKATVRKANVVWQKGEVVPTEGEVAFNGFRGRFWSIRYGRADGGDAQVTVTRRGVSRTYQFPAAIEPDGE